METEPRAHKLWEIQEPYTLTRVIIAAYSNDIGTEPGQMPPETFAEEFSFLLTSPDSDKIGMDDKQKVLAQRFGSWGAQNIIAMRLGEVDDAKITKMDKKLLRLTGNDETGAEVMTAIRNRIDTRDRTEIIPLLRVMVGRAVRLFDNPGGTSLPEATE